MLPLSSFLLLSSAHHPAPSWPARGEGRPRHPRLQGGGGASANGGVVQGRGTGGELAKLLLILLFVTIWEISSFHAISWHKYFASTVISRVIILIFKTNYSLTHKTAVFFKKIFVLKSPRSPPPPPPPPPCTACSSPTGPSSSSPPSRGTTASTGASPQTETGSPGAGTQRWKSHVSSHLNLSSFTLREM